jgi:hypothetical protein
MPWKSLKPLVPVDHLVAEPGRFLLLALDADLEDPPIEEKLLVPAPDRRLVAELMEERLDPGRLLLRSFQERPDRLGLELAHREDSQAVAVDELEAGVLVPDLVPELPDAEVLLPDVGVMEEDDAPLAYLGQPGFEVMADGVVGMETIDVEQVDRAVDELRDGFIERGPDQGRKAFIERVVVLTEVGEDLGAIFAGVCVAVPGVHREASSAQIERLDGLAEPAIRPAVVGP